jgi:diacylglycerol kinase family enzyme
MRHLFIINPEAGQIKGRIDDIVQNIRVLFAGFPELGYYIHVTRWKRDAVGFVRRYVSDSPQIVRVYAVGGTGTFFEVINGGMGLANVQIAFWPFGNENLFLQYFGESKMDHFRSLRNLVFSEVASFDVMRCGNSYGICNGFMGMETLVARDGDRIINLANTSPALSNLIYLAVGGYYGLKKKKEQPYSIRVDGKVLDGSYISLMAANQPYNANRMCPAPEAVPNDGLLDLYLVRPVPYIQHFAVMLDYVRGRYRKWPAFISHIRGKKISVSSGRIIPVCLDGEYFYDSHVDFEVVPHAVDLACPCPAGRLLVKIGAEPVHG